MVTNTAIGGLALRVYYHYNATSNLATDSFNIDSTNITSLSILQLSHKRVKLQPPMFGKYWFNAVI